MSPLARAAVILTRGRGRKRGNRKERKGEKAKGFLAGRELNFRREGNGYMMKRYAANGLAQFALHTSDIFHVCQQSDAILPLLPSRSSKLLKNRVSLPSDYHHPSSSVKNATLFPHSPRLSSFDGKKGAFQGPFDKSTKSCSSSKRFFQRSFFFLSIFKFTILLDLELFFYFLN